MQSQTFDWRAARTPPEIKVFIFLIISKTAAFPESKSNTDEAVALVIKEPENLGP